MEITKELINVKIRIYEVWKVYTESRQLQHIEQFIGLGKINIDII